MQHVSGYKYFTDLFITIILYDSHSYVRITDEQVDNMRGIKK